MAGSTVLTIAGITLSTIGTVLSLWTVITTSCAYKGTCNEFANRNRDFRKEKRLVIIGCVLIVLGASAQIVALLIPS